MTSAVVATPGGLYHPDRFERRRAGPAQSRPGDGEIGASSGPTGRSANAFGSGRTPPVMEKVRIDDVDDRMGPADVKRPLSRALGAEHVAINYYELDPGESFAFGYPATRSRRNCSTSSRGRSPSRRRTARSRSPRRERSGSGRASPSAGSTPATSASSRWPSARPRSPATSTSCGSVSTAATGRPHRSNSPTTARRS